MRIGAGRQRWEALDDLRGLAVFCMVPVNVAASFTSIPGWFKHAPANGLTLADLVLPVFLFSLGLSAAFSFRSRVAADGFGKTLLHASVRYGVLFLFGTIGILFVDRGASWEILQMLGATGLFAFFFLPLPPRYRLAAALLLLAAVEVLRPFGLGSMYRRWYESGIAGPWGTGSLAFVVIVASALGELIKDSSTRRRLLLSGLPGAAFCAAGMAALIFVPFSKHLLSLSYILFTTGLSALLLALLVLCEETLRLPIPIVGSLGRNPLLFYMVHAVLSVAVHALLGDDVPAAVAWLSAFLVLALCAAAAVALDRRKLYLKL